MRADRLVWIGLGVGAVVVYVATRPGGGGLAGLFGSTFGFTPASLNAAQVASLTPAQRAAFESGFVVHLTPEQAALSAGSAAAPFAVVTFGIAPAIAAIAAYFGTKNSNDTREDREVFAKKIGFRQLGGEVDGLHQAVTSLAGRDSLYGYLNFIGAGDLTAQGLNAIGRKDFDGNIAWMNRVLNALLAVSFPFPLV